MSKRLDIVRGAWIVLRKEGQRSSIRKAAMLPEEK